MKNNRKSNSVNAGIVIYQGKNGGIEFKGDIKKDTIWATQAQISELFGSERSVITKHIRNVFKDGELVEKSVCAKFAHTGSDGKTYDVQFYNLDMVISIGYRVNSKVATEFRKWATKILKDYSLNGFAINRKLVGKNYQKFLEAVEEIRTLLPANSEEINGEHVLDLVKLFSSTWLSLDAYDKESLETKKITKEFVALTASDLVLAIDNLKNVLMEKGEATQLFATDRHKNSLEGIIGNVMQSIGGKHVYGSVEEKAAHLLYFIIKNHPFADGNKRSGAFAFVWYLEKNKRLDIGKVSPSALTAFTILVAESNPKHKEKIVNLIMKLIEK